MTPALRMMSHPAQLLRFVSQTGVAAQEMSDETLLHALSTLSPQEAEVLRLRFGIGGDPLTLHAVGSRYSLSRERIRQIEAKALRKLRHPSRGLRIRSGALVRDG